MDSSPSIDSLFAASPVMTKRNGGGAAGGAHRARNVSTPTQCKPLGSSSSPTASLAADLSQNFHITSSRSPVIPTPRRALFPSLSFQTTDEFNANNKRRCLLDSPLDGNSSTGSCRRKSKFRRTQSMFENAQDVVMGDSPATPANGSISEESSGSPGGCYFDSAEETPPFRTTTVKEDPFRRIDRDTLCEIMDGKYAEHYAKHILIDCRFEYEYNGGHINGAININSKDQLQSELLNNIDSIEHEHRRTIIVFHCEYSAHRGPRMAMHLRNLDRLLNVNRYPYLYYPDVFILSGGYSHFFDAFHTRCFPQRYVEMNHQDYKHTCERELGKFKKNMSFYKFPPKPPRSNNLFISKQKLFV
jgi:rhodanese-related sulfurtransferase